eukprot:COSAG06_NODE_3067_length_5897_cov_5.614005_9_plen_53_part_00
MLNTGRGMVRETQRDAFDAVDIENCSFCRDKLSKNTSKTLIGFLEINPARGF